MPKSVLIVGGGPSGLVAAKTLLHSHPSTFTVTLFEKTSTIGGLWPLSPSQSDGLLNPEMPTNVSKHTVCFSDFAWDSVGLGDGHVPLFPKAWQVGRYLEAYVAKFGLEECIRCNCEVVRAGRERYGEGWRWNIEWMGPGDGKEDVGTNVCASNPKRSRRYQGFFDYLLVATGYFNTPKIPKVPGLDLFRDKIKTLHSSHFRGIEDLMTVHKSIKFETCNGVSTHDSRKRGNKVVVLGGSMSGAEVAAPLALEISSAKYSPKGPASSDIASLEVHQIASRPSYIIPPILPVSPQTPDPKSKDTTNTNPAPTFLPLDFCLFNLSRRPKGPISASAGEMPTEIAKAMHKFLQTVLGGRQEDLGAEPMTFVEKHESSPPHVVIDERYDEFVRAGDIKLTAGKAIAFDVDEDEKGTITVVNGDKETMIADIACVVLATGYEPHPALHWFSEQVKKILELDTECDGLPVILQEGSYSHHEISEIGFVGLYQGPYWGILEMQARLIARNWAEENHARRYNEEGTVEGNLEKMRNLRKAMKDSAPGVPQAWMNDYVGFMEEMARGLGIERLPLEGENEREGPVVLARYSHQAPNEHETVQGIRSIEEILRTSKDEGRLVARAAFRALHGKWKLSRQLKSEHWSFPSGTFTGTAWFHPRLPTASGFDSEYLYIEEGEFVTEQGLRIQGGRRYAYRLNHENDKISVWFVKTDDELSVDYLFNELEFDTQGGKDGWRAKGYHLCVSDQYHSGYLFAFSAIALKKFRIEYFVKGPKKEYTSTGEYRR